MEIIILGSSGQVGKELQKVFPGSRAIDQKDIDLSVPGAVAAFDFSGVDVVINAAAYTQVDHCETQEGALLASHVNAMAVLDLAEASRKYKFTLIHYSTDYVFDGEKITAYTEEDAPNPLNIYGKTKLAGDMAAQEAPRYYIVRTSWVYGEGKNFIKTMLELAQTKKEVAVVSDQIGRPTYARDIALATASLIHGKAPFGLYNFTNSGEPVSWAGFAEEIFKQANKPIRVKHITTADYAKKTTSVAMRPQRSVLDLSKIEYFGVIPRSWREALADFLRTML